MSGSPVPQTDFADAQRSTYASIEADNASFLIADPLAMFLEEYPDPILILNSCRQAVFANTAAWRLFELEGMKELLGLRLGEILQCPNATGHIGGCGTTVACRSCGVVNAVLTALNGNPATKTCRVEAEIAGRKTTCSFEERAVPVQWEGKPFVVTLLTGLTRL